MDSYPPDKKALREAWIVINYPLDNLNFNREKPDFLEISYLRQLLLGICENCPCCNLE